MFTAKEAFAELTALAAGEQKHGRVLCYKEDSAFVYCPVCGTHFSGTTWEFAVIDARNPVTNQDGLRLVLYFRHPKTAGANAHPPRTCLMTFAGAPAGGDMARALLRYGDALQILGMEKLMQGKA
jgi:hypothetical protein